MSKATYGKAYANHSINQSINRSVSCYSFKLKATNTANKSATG